MKNSKLIRTDLAVVAIGYNIEPKDFKNFAQSKFLKEYGLDEIEPDISIDKNTPNYDLILQDIKSKFPILNYRNKDGSISIVLLSNENKINISYFGYVEEKNEKIKKLLDDILFCRPAEISDIGINFTSFYACDSKLMLLNPNIEKIKDWKNNKTFILTIPIEYKEYMATYNIQKMFQSKKGEIIERVYRFNVNFNVKIGESSDSREKFDLIKNITSALYQYHEEFNKKCKEFLELGDDESR